MQCAGGYEKRTLKQFSKFRGCEDGGVALGLWGGLLQILAFVFLCVVEGLTLSCIAYSIKLSDCVLYDSRMKQTRHSHPTMNFCSLLMANLCDTRN